jgi:hypothetical protein
MKCEDVGYVPKESVDEKSQFHLSTHRKIISRSVTCVIAHLVSQVDDGASRGL